MRRRWLGVVGLVVALAGALMWRSDRPHYEAEVTVQTSWVDHHVGVRESGAVRVFSKPDGQIAVRGTGTTAERATAAASTYAGSYIQKRDEDAARGLGDAADQIRQRIALLQAEIAQAGAEAPPPSWTSTG